MPITCPTCGTQLAPNARFCPKDGTTIRADTIAVAVAVSGSSSVERPTPSPGASADEVDPLVGCTIDGRYRVRQVLGTGGVGAVYEGEHIEMKKPVAVKVLHAMFASSDEFKKRFEREARAASKLTHPSCVSVLDFGRVARIETPDGSRPAAKLIGMPYLVMEFVRGSTLVERIDERAGVPFDGTEAVMIARGVLSALRHAHGLGLVHRDVKPANIMLTESAGSGVMVKLLDFGLAKDLEPDSRAEPLTQAGMVFGTPGYLSPEQAAGGTIDARSDLYSLGVVLFEMACGRRPFVHEDPIDAVRDHLNTPPPRPRSFNSALSPELERVILSSLVKDPRARVQSAEAFIAALAATPEGLGRTTRGSPRARWSSTAARVGEGVKRRPRVAVGTVAGLLALVGGLALVRDRKPARQPSAVAAPVDTPLRSPDAVRHLQLAEAYQKKLWCSDALDELERALRDQATLKGDLELQRVAIGCLGGRSQPRAIKFLVERVGPDGVPALQAARADGTAEVRRGAERTLQKLGAL